MARYPEIQAKVHEEIDREIADRAPSMSDKSKLKYTEAVLCEIQRVAALIPIGFLRVTKDITLRGYRVPENTIALANLYAVHRDTRTWKDPEHFHVENFYDEKSDSLKNTEKLVPFSLGRFPLSFFIYRISTKLERCRNKFIALENSLKPRV